VKRCPRCRRDLPRDAFTRDKNRASGLKVWCRECCAAVASDPAYRQRRRESRRSRLERDPDYERRWDLLRLYNITLERWDEMFTAQGGACAVCRQPAPEGERLHVDHDHACCPTGSSCGRCVRALLCSRCNTAVGWVETRGHDWWTAIAEFASERAYA
jgi:hypothetical protein